jgi:hypothetical protein
MMRIYKQRWTCLEIPSLESVKRNALALVILKFLMDDVFMCMYKGTSYHLWIAGSFKWECKKGEADSRRLTSFHLAFGPLVSKCMTSNLSTMSHCPDIILTLTLWNEREWERETKLVAFQLQLHNRHGYLRI